MKLEDQACTLEQGEALKSMGVLQESLFYHTHSKWGVMPKSSIDFTGNPTSAFTPAELGVMLPSESGIIGWEVYYNDHLGCWNCVIRDLVKWKGGSTIPPVAYDAEADSMAEAMADALIHCIENKLATPEEINNRLND